jgi:hypothetical protein
MPCHDVAMLGWNLEAAGKLDFEASPSIDELRAK